MPPSPLSTLLFTHQFRLCVFVHPRFLFWEGGCDQNRHTHTHSLSLSLSRPHIMTPRLGSTIRQTRSRCSKQVQGKQEQRPATNKLETRHNSNNSHTKRKKLDTKHTPHINRSFPSPPRWQSAKSKTRAMQKRNLCIAKRVCVCVCVCVFVWVVFCFFCERAQLRCREQSIQQLRQAPQQ